MLTILFCILLIWVMWKVGVLMLKLTCSAIGVVLMIIFLPVILLGMVFFGLISLAFPLLIVIGLVSLVMGFSLE